MFPQAPAYNVESEESQLNNPQVVFSWTAPIRAYKKRGVNVLRFYIAVSILLSVLIFILGDKILILPIWAVLFLFYVLTITPPPQIEHKISKFGIEAAGITYRWESLSHFYFTNRFGFPILTLVSSPPFFTRAFLVVPDDSTRSQLIKLLSEHVVYQEKPSLTLTDYLINVLSYLMPDEDKLPADSTPPQSKSPTSPVTQTNSNSISEVKDTLASFFQTHKTPFPSPPSSSPM